MNMLRVAYYFCCDVSDVCKCACGLGRVNILCIKAECNLYIVYRCAFYRFSFVALPLHQH